MSDCCGKGIQRIAHGAVGLAKAALGIGAVPELVRRERLTRCQRCEHSTKHPSRRSVVNGLPLVRFCRLCGCWIDAKTRNADEKCCLGKW